HLEGPGTRLGHAPQAGAAPPARREVLVDDAVALGERQAGPVAFDTGAEGVDDAGHLVADDAAVVAGHEAQEAVASPDVQVRAAHVGAGDPHDRGARFGVGHRELGQRERLAGTVEQRRPACRGHVADVPASAAGALGASSPPTRGATSVANSSMERSSRSWGTRPFHSQAKIHRAGSRANSRSSWRVTVSTDPTSARLSARKSGISPVSGWGRPLSNPNGANQEAKPNIGPSAHKAMASSSVSATTTSRSRPIPSPGSRPEVSA